MLPLVIVFIVVPLAELYVIIEVGGLIGVWPTIGLLALDSLLGAALLRVQGRSVWRQFNAALAERRIPHRETFDGALVIAGGALLLTPGFITDALGLSMLIPATRILFRRLLTVIALRRFSMGQRAVFWTAGQAGARRPGSEGPGGAPRQAYDVDGTAQEVPDDSAPGQGPALPP